jgi:GH15 family glucan-1,4-alpha-glucosidase
LRSVHELHAGERLDVVLSWGGGHRHHRFGEEELLTATARSWRQWMQGFDYEGPEANLVRWEVRSEGRVFTYSAGLRRVALDRAARLAAQLHLPGPVSKWQRAAAELRATVLESSWDEAAQTLSEHLDGGGSLDASLLALPLRRVVPAEHLRMVATTAAVAERLSAGGGLL